MANPTESTSLVSDSRNGAPITHPLSIDVDADTIDDLLYAVRVNDAHVSAELDAFCQAHHSDPAQALLAVVDPDRGDTLLHMAAGNGHCNMIDMLHARLTQSSSQTQLQHPSDSSPHSTSTPSIPLSQTTSPSSPQPSASDSNPQSAWHRLLNQRNHSGSTPLHWAAVNGHLAAVQRLVLLGADTSIATAAGRTAADEAERASRDDVVVYLLSVDANADEQSVGPNSTNGESATAHSINGEIATSDSSNGEIATVDSINGESAHDSRPGESKQTSDSKRRSAIESGIESLEINGEARRLKQSGLERDSKDETPA